ncbi:uncharacterized protein TNCV_3453521 [Trichonephila clavipes]|nr:uncharacterized protein TNCV_3453521 [Trichonephila clavipes]
MIFITAEIDSGFIAKDDLVPFRCSPISSCATPLHTEASMEDTRVPSEGATYAWMAADEAVGCTRAFLMMWWPSRRLGYREHPELGLRLNDVSRIHWS